jgi:uncharacterized protein
VEAAESEPDRRLVALDFVRGVAILGILLLNVVGFAWPAVVYLSPRAPGGPTSGADDLVYLVTFVLADGKFRGLFSLLFGASLLLFVERADARGNDGLALQCRRLGWLALFGLAHFFLLWWGDILFLFAVCGFAALTVSHWRPARLVRAALTIYAAGVLALGAVTVVPAAPWLGLASAGTAASERLERGYAAEARHETTVMRGPWTGIVAHTTRHQWSSPLNTIAVNWFETLPLILIGMALLKSGFFAGGWPAARLRRWAAGWLVLGLALTLPLAALLWREGFPLALVLFVSHSPAAVGRLAMVLGYAALLVLAARRGARTPLGERVVAAGRTAFSNYIGTSLLMTALFHGWGLGLFARYGRLELLGFVALGWAAMLAWSKPWLARYRHGPLEWLWRALTYGQIGPLRRKPVATEIDSH